MKTLNQTKDEVAKNRNYHDWIALEQDCFSVPFISSAMEEAAKLYAESALKEVLKRKYEDTHMVMKVTGGSFKTIDDIILSLISELK